MSQIRWDTHDSLSDRVLVCTELAIDAHGYGNELYRQLEDIINGPVPRDLRWHARECDIERAFR